jgi:hypothetical protein
MNLFARVRMSSECILKCSDDNGIAIQMVLSCDGVLA